MSISLKVPFHDSLAKLKAKVSYLGMCSSNAWHELWLDDDIRTRTVHRRVE